MWGGRYLDWRQKRWGELRMVFGHESSSLTSEAPVSVASLPHEPKRPGPSSPSGIVGLSQDRKADTPPETAHRCQEPSERRGAERWRGEADHRAVPATKSPQRTWTRAELYRLVEVFARIWISGEVQREPRTRPGDGTCRHVHLPSTRGRLRSPVQRDAPEASLPRASALSRNVATTQTAPKRCQRGVQSRCEPGDAFLVAVSEPGEAVPVVCDLWSARRGWNAGRAPGSDGGVETSPQHQEPWCQSALPYRWAHAPAHVAVARAATLPTPPMPNGR